MLVMMRVASPAASHARALSYTGVTVPAQGRGLVEAMPITGNATRVPGGSLGSHLATKDRRSIESGLPNVGDKRKRKEVWYLQ